MIHQLAPNLPLWLLSLMIVSACSKKDPPASETSASNSEQAHPSKAIPVKTLILKKQVYQDFGNFIGQLSPLKEARLITQAGGRVNQVLASEGQMVAPNKKLCDIEEPRHAIAKETAEIQAKLQKEMHERALKHFAQQTIAKTQLDRIQLEALDAERLRLEAEDRYKGATCMSPIGGMVIYRGIDPFDQTQPGSPTLHIADLSSMKFTIGVPENQMRGFVVGAPATLQLENSPDRKWEGKISSLSGRVDPNTKTFRIELTFSNQDLSLKSGVTGTVEILRSQIDSALVVPIGSLINLADGLAVYVARDGLAKRISVVVESKGAEFALIRSGLEEGDELIVERSPSLADDSPIQVVGTL